MAASRVRVKFTGGKELEQALREMGEEWATKAGYRANLKAAQHMRDRYVEAAPYQPGPTVKSWKRKDGTVVKADYGHLKENIRVRRDKSRKQGNVVHLVTAGKAFWGRFLEYGTRKMAARPWMRPAFEAHREQAVDIQLGELNSLIERAAKRIRGAKAKK